MTLLLRSLCLAILFIAGSGTARTDSIADLFSRVKASVVVILVEEQDLSESARTGDYISTGSLGSGVLISADGRILTAAHVVQTADAVSVMFEDSTVVPARILSSHPNADVALLQTEFVPPGAAVAPVGNSDLVQTGDQVFIIGAPYGLAYTLTSGIISSRHKPEMMFSDFLEGELFQTDAAINAGNSGGPMFNMKGEVIGIVSYILTQSGGFEGLGFAVTSRFATSLVMEGGAFWSGLAGERISGDLCRIMNVPQSSAILVTHVAANSPASRIGLKGGFLEASVDGEPFIVGGDIILSILGVSTDTSTQGQIRNKIMSLMDGDTFSLVVWSNGERKELSMIWSRSVSE